MMKLMKNESGFTLVELMVVILIIAILIAVAVPVFLGARGRAQDNAARQAAMNVGRAVAAEYAGVTPNALPTVAAAQTAEPAYDILAAAQAGGGLDNDADDLPDVVYAPAAGTCIAESDNGAATATVTVNPANGSITKSW